MSSLLRGLSLLLLPLCGWLAGLVVVLSILVKQISALFATIRSLFAL